jgi:hypothetical protein
MRVFWERAPSAAGRVQYRDSPSLQCRRLPIGGLLSEVRHMTRDSTVYAALMAERDTDPGAIFAESGYDSDAMRQNLPVAPRPRFRARATGGCGTRSKRDRCVPVLVLSLYAGLLAPNATATAYSASMVSARRVQDFVNSLGVNTHISQGFTDIARVLSALRYLGISNIRDGINGSISCYRILARAGVRLDGVWDFQSLQTTISEANAIAQLSPAALRFVEGPNEPNNEPVTYNGARTSMHGTFLPAAQLQADLYKAVKADPAVGNVPVIDLSSGGAEPDDVGLQYLTIPSGAGTAMPDDTRFADYANIHVYPHNGRQNIASRGNRIQNELSAQYGTTWAAGYSGYSGSQLVSLPKVMTEFGYPTVGPGTDSNAVDQTVQANNMLNMIMDAASEGYSTMYAYELFDQPGLSGNEASFGLLTASGSPKLVAIAIHNLTSILADRDATASTFAPGSLSYSVSNLPSTGKSMLLEKSNGAFDIAVWNEAPDWSSVTHSEIRTPMAASTVSFGETAETVKVFDPVVGSKPIQTLHNVNQVQVRHTNHPLVVEVEHSRATIHDSGSTITNSSR